MSVTIGGIWSWYLLAALLTYGFVLGYQIGVDEGRRVPQFKTPFLLALICAVFWFAYWLYILYENFWPAKWK